MFKKLIIILMLLSLGCLPGLAAAPAAASDNSPVYVIAIDGPVEKGLSSYLGRAFREAERNGAAAIIFELNTYGGMIDAAGDISDLIQNSTVPVYAYVRYRAISAGAYLALSSDALYMAPGSNIGAAEPRSLLGGDEVIDEKTISIWESEMKSMAERQGKDPQVAAAMVRKEIAIPGVVEEGQLLTLTAAEALNIGFADGIYSNNSQLLAELGLSDSPVLTVGTSPAEDLARTLTHPALATLLITIGIAALVIEVMTAGFGVAGIISILSFALFFGAHTIAGLAGREVVFLFALGLIFLLVEAFIPNFGIIGLTGIGLIVVSVVTSAATTGEGIQMLLVSIFGAAVIIALSYRYLRKSGLWSQIVLQYAETKEQGYVGPGDATHLVGQIGVTLTPLRPAGVAEIEGKRVDVVSEGGFIAKDSEVKVVSTEGTRIVVRPL
ncbi:MAG: nodulation protein NfeD [Dethiobacter sp.]|nr:nodulation protein NfeD [Dethiobacter sp.]